MWFPGQTVLDRYQLVERLGEGLGGETWEAEGPAGPVAVKVIAGEGRAQDLLREAALLREVRHPNIVAYREFADRPDENCTILVTELVGGGDLRSWVALEGPRSPVQTARCGLQIVEALGVLDRIGVLHRDLKPANVFVGTTESGELQLRVGDFGISRPLRDGMARTQDRSLTPSYAAPEQLTGLPLTRATDLFALGGVLSFLATGRDPQGSAETGHDALDLLVGALRHPDPARRPDLAATRRSLAAIAAGMDGAPNPPPVEIASSTVTWEPTGDFGRTLLPPTTEPAPTSDEPTKAPRGWSVGVVILAVVAAAAWMVLRPSDPSVVSDRSDDHAVVAPVPVEPVPEPQTEPEPKPRPVAEPAAPPPPAVRPAPTPAPVVAEGPRLVGFFVNSRPWSHVSIDGERVGRTSDTGARFEVPSGEHVVRLESSAGLSWQRVVDVGPATRLCVNLRTGTEFGC